MNTLRKFIEKDIQMSGIYFLISSNYFDFIYGHWPKCPWQFIKYPKLIVKPVIGTKLSAIMIVTNLRTKKMGFNFCISVENSTFRNPSFLHMKILPGLISCVIKQQNCLEASRAWSSAMLT